LHDRLIHLGCATVLDTLALIENDKVTTTMQEDNLSYKTAPKLTKENCKINWTRSAGEIYNLIRGLSPYPAAWCVFYDKNEEWNVKIYDSKITIETHTFEIGSVFSSKKEIKIAVRDGFISILSLQFPGKKKMTAAEFLNGLQFSNAARVN
jgi:methionyl-tRNA formyltransferase